MLPVSNEHSFTVSIVGDKTRQKYEGQFTVKCLMTNAELIELGLRLDQYNRGSQTLAPGAALLNRAFAELEVRIVTDEKSGQQKAPLFWRESDGGRRLLDQNVVYEIFEKAREAEQIYVDRLTKATEETEDSAESAAKAKTAKQQS